MTFIKRRKIHDRKGPLFLTDGSHHFLALVGICICNLTHTRRKKGLNGITPEKVIWQAIGKLEKQVILPTILSFTIHRRDGEIPNDEISRH